MYVKQRKGLHVKQRKRDNEGSHLPIESALTIPSAEERIIESRKGIHVPRILDMFDFVVRALSL